MKPAEPDPAVPSSDLPVEADEDPEPETPMATCPAEALNELEHLHLSSDEAWSEKNSYLALLGASVEQVPGASALAQKLLLKQRDDSDEEGSEEMHAYYGNAAYLLVAQAPDAETLFSQAREILSQNNSPALRQALLYQIGSRYEGFE